MVLSMAFGEDEEFWWQRLRIFSEDYGFFGEDYRFFYFSSSAPKILHLCQCLHCILLIEALALSMCRHTNEGIPSTEHLQMLHWACADMLMRGNPVTDWTHYTHNWNQSRLFTHSPEGITCINRLTQYEFIITKRRHFSVKFKKENVLFTVMASLWGS